MPAPPEAPPMVPMALCAMSSDEELELALPEDDDEESEELA